jgi:hypothetical protein
MSLEDRIRTSVDAALDDLRTRVEGEMRELVDQLVAAASQDREDAVNAARRQAFDEAWETARRDAAEQNARAREVAEQTVAEARAGERAAAERRLQEALVSAEIRFAQQRREAEQQAAGRVEAIRAAGENALAHAAQSHSRLLEGIRGLDGATTLSEVLDVMAASIRREAARVAVLVVRSDRLVGWKLSGFGPRDMHPKAVDIALTESGLAGRAIVEGRPVTGSGVLSTGLLIDEPSGTDAVAVPILVGGRAVAVVYASQPAEASVVSGWHDNVEILARHGSRCLEALTVQKAATPAAPRFWVPPGPARGAVDREPGDATPKRMP